MTRPDETRPNAPLELETLEFEDALAQLEQIVRSLDAGQSNLEKSLQDYEKGIRLLRHCHATLQNAEQRIEILKNVAADGTLISENADANQFSTDAAKPGQRRGGSGQVPEVGESAQTEKVVRKKRANKTMSENNFDATNEIPFDF